MRRAVVGLLFLGSACSSSTQDLGTTDASGPMDAAVAHDSGAHVPDTGGVTIDAGAFDEGIPDLGQADLGVPDTGAPDLGVPDSGPTDSGPTDTGTTASDAGTAMDASAPDAGSPRLGTIQNPVASCLALLQAVPTTTSGYYYVDPNGGAITDARLVFCDMDTNGGGWTQVETASGQFPESDVNLIRGVTGREMLKCNDGTPEHIISPPFALTWSWTNMGFRQLGGTWIVNGANQTCGTNPEYTQYTCASWWGFGCGDGPGGNNKLFPGVLDSPSAGFCADSTSGHTNGAFSICGTNNYRTYSVFVREENVAIALDHLRAELPCTGPHSGDGCPAATSAQSLTFGGAAGASYDVTLRIRGVVEEIGYSGGTTTGFVNVGGTPDPVGYNSYAIVVGSPAQTYYLNAGTTGIRYCFALDYMLTVQIDGGASLMITGDSRDGSEIVNQDMNGTPIVVPGIPPAPNAFDGQFVQFDVVSVTLH